MSPATTERARTRQSATLLPGRSWWVDLYSLLLVALFATFYGLIIGAILELFRLAEWLFVNEWNFDAADFLRAVLIVLVTIFLLRLAKRLAVGLLGLVTAKYDDVPELRESFALDLERYPELYRVVAEVGRHVAGPLPDEIRVTHMPECYVTEQRQFAFRTHRRLILVLGLPQLLVFSLTELKVILAHEMTHFRGGDTTLGVFFYRFLESLRVAVEEMQPRWWRWLDPIYWMCKAFFHLFLYASAPVRREHELHADCTSAAVYGGELAAHTLLKDWLIAHQFDESVAEYVEHCERGEIADGVNVFGWFADHWREFSDAGHDYLARRLAETEHPSSADSHPSIARRIQAMRAYAPRETADATPARDLLDDLPELEQRLQRQWLGEAGA
jgi:Zn-dependent protease with chaperone function